MFYSSLFFFLLFSFLFFCFLLFSFSLSFSFLFFSFLLFSSLFFSFLFFSSLFFSSLLLSSLLFSSLVFSCLLLSSLLFSSLPFSSIFFCSFLFTSFPFSSHRLSSFFLIFLVISYLIFSHLLSYLSSFLILFFLPFLILHPLHLLFDLSSPFYSSLVTCSISPFSLQFVFWTHLFSSLIISSLHFLYLLVLSFPLIFCLHYHPFPTLFFCNLLLSSPLLLFLFSYFLSCYLLLPFSLPLVSLSSIISLPFFLSFCPISVVLSLSFHSLPFASSLPSVLSYFIFCFLSLSFILALFSAYPLPCIHLPCLIFFVFLTLPPFSQFQFNSSVVPLLVSSILFCFRLLISFFALNFALLSVFFYTLIIFFSLLFISTTGCPKETTNV